VGCATPKNRGARVGRERRLTRSGLTMRGSGDQGLPAQIWAPSEQQIKAALELKASAKSPLTLQERDRSGS
jgi:hypothetical protein